MGLFIGWCQIQKVLHDGLRTGTRPIAKEILHSLTSFELRILWLCLLALPPPNKWVIGSLRALSSWKQQPCILASAMYRTHLKSCTTFISKCTMSVLNKVKSDFRSQNLSTLSPARDCFHAKTQPAIYAQWYSPRAVPYCTCLNTKQGVRTCGNFDLRPNRIYAISLRKRRPWHKTLGLAKISCSYAYNRTSEPVSKHVGTRSESLSSSLTCTSLFPLMPIAVELPQYIPQAALVFAMIVSSVVVLLRPSCRLFLLIQLPDMSFRRAMFEVWFLFPVASFPMFSVQGLYLPGLSGVRSRLAINILCFVQLVAAALDPRFVYSPIGLRSLGWLGLFSVWAYCISTCMFGVAVLLYGIANARRQSWVSSRLLGGTGIEPMVLVLPEWGPSHESVGDEAREGAIRL
jgi:hypothetical protein